MGRTEHGVLERYRVERHDRGMIMSNNDPIDRFDNCSNIMIKGKLGTNLFVYITMVFSFVQSFVLNSCSKSLVISIT